MKHWFAVLVLLLLLCGCGASVKGHFPTGRVRLHQYPKLHLMLSTATGTISVNRAVLMSPSGPIGASHVLSGSSQVLIVAQNLSFKLGTLGFQMVDSQGKADAIVLFSIGAVRHDPLAGWIADQAFLVFKDAKSETTLCTFRANSQFVTPTVNRIVENLVDEVGKHY